MAARSSRQSTCMNHTKEMTKLAGGWTKVYLNVSLFTPHRFVLHPVISESCLIFHPIFLLSISDYNIMEKIDGMTSIRDEQTMTQYAYGTTGMVSYDDERAICDKTDYAQVHDLNGYIIWELR